MSTEYHSRNQVLEIGDLIADYGNGDMIDLSLLIDKINAPESINSDSIHLEFGFKETNETIINNFSTSSDLSNIGNERGVAISELETLSFEIQFPGMISILFVDDGEEVHSTLVW